MAPSRPRTDHTHVLLLRGINVGPHRRVPKEDLVRWAEEGGARDVSTHLASGNVLVRLPGGADPQAVAEAVARAAREERGLDVPVLWTTPAELRAALAVHDALPWAGGEPRLTSLTLLERAPDPAAVVALEALDAGPDRLHVGGRHLWIRHGVDVRSSPLTLDRIERTLGVTGTARNLATVRALAGLPAGA